MKELTMWSYINQEQPILLEVLEAYPKNIDTALFQLPDFDDILILGTGSSINAALSARCYLEKMTNKTVTIQEPFNFQHYAHKVNHPQLVLGISQSGQSTSTIDALNHLNNQSFKIGVTSIPNSEITQVTDTTLDILSGKERVGYVSLGFTASVLALMLLGLRLGVRLGIVSEEQEKQELVEFKQLLEQIELTIKLSQSFFKKNEQSLRESQRFMSIAYGPALGTAKEMETKFSETIRVPSQGLDLEAFMHGPYLEMNDTYRLFFLDTPAKPLVQKKAQLLRTYEEKVTSHIFVVSIKNERTPTLADPNRHLLLPEISDENKCPLLLILPFQVLSWFISRSKGIDITKRIFTDFSQAVESKTTFQDYV
ncbi:SIS domain-containing protein [Enterococcus sp. DIV0175]|uniref:SIS domain-containing protein n=1 Tax=unclassified Enterococcus TaxID=2608891 RepID=UPI003D2FE12D